jgi:hypothetical protein
MISCSSNFALFDLFVQLLVYSCSPNYVLYSYLSCYVEICVN